MSVNRTMASLRGETRSPDIFSSSSEDEFDFDNPSLPSVSPPTALQSKPQDEDVAELLSKIEIQEEKSYNDNIDDEADTELINVADSPRRVPLAPSVFVPKKQESKTDIKEDKSDKENFDDEADTEFINIADSPRRVAPSVSVPKKKEPRTIFLNELPEPAGAAALPRGIPSSAVHADVSNLLTKLSKLMESVPGPDEVEETPARIRATLYPHQSYGLKWLWWREHHYPGGGILADEMGLGKTIMILSLVVKSHDEGVPTYVDEEEEDDDSEWNTTIKKLIPSKSTLIVVPASVITQWETEISSKARNVRVYSYHGPRRTKSAAELSRCQIVLTTYSTLKSDIPKEDNYRCDSPLMRINFERIVLDEGHEIRNPQTHTAKACCKVNARHRWVVTGTPVHNSPSDLFSLVKFLRLSPFNDSSLWDFWVGLKKLSKTEDSNKRLEIISNALVLRRTKDEVGAVEGAPKIPPKTIFDLPIELSDGEREVYDHLEEFAQSEYKNFMKSKEGTDEMKQKKADEYVAGPSRQAKANGGETKKGFHHILTLLLRMRQCVVLPHLIHSMIDDDENANQDLDSSLPPDDEIISMKNPVFNKNFQSAKIKEFLNLLQTIQDNCKTEGRPMDKVVVVSEWPSFLDLLKFHIEALGLRTCEINGKVNVQERGAVAKEFNDKHRRSQVMLLSLKAGGVGLNLVGANHLVFMDIHWNPQNERQAMDRIHRFGQTKDVNIYRFICSNSVEQRVLALQQEKLNLADSVLSASSKTGSGLSAAEMRRLFEC